MRIEEVVATAQDGDDVARDDVANWLSETLNRFLAHMIRGSSLETEDMRQRVCVVVFEHLHEFEDRGPESFGHWVREIARRRVLEGWRVQTRETARLDQLAHHPRSSTLSFVSRMTLIELEQQLGEAFISLSEIQREAILWEYEGRDDAELAERWQVTVNAVRSHRSRGRKQLVERTKKMRKDPLPRLSSPAKHPNSSSSQKI